MPREEKVDLRVRKTERALVEAMMALLKEKTYEEVTVSDLCETAMVRRATFYRHFKDKDDFLDFCLEQRRISFEAMLQAVDSPCDRADFYSGVLRELLRFLRENEILYIGQKKRTERREIKQMLAQRFMQAIADEARERDLREGPLPVPPEVAAAFFSGALVGVARWWSVAQPEMREDELIGYVTTLLRGATGCRRPDDVNAPSPPNPNDKGV